MSLLTPRRAPWRPATAALQVLPWLLLSACWQERHLVAYSVACEGSGCDDGERAEPEALRLLSDSTRVPWDVRAVTPLADGQRVVFLADGNDLFLGEVGGGQARRLTDHAGGPAELLGLSAAQDRAVLRLSSVNVPSSPNLFEVVALDAAPATAVLRIELPYRQCVTLFDAAGDRLLHTCGSDPPRIEATALDGSSSGAVSAAVASGQSITAIEALPGGEALYTVATGGESSIEIWRARAGEGQDQLLATASRLSTERLFLLSPDKARLIYTRTAASGEGVIAVMRVDGSASRDLAPVLSSTANQWRDLPAWLSPTTVALVDASATARHLALVDVDTGGRVDLTLDARLDDKIAVDPRAGRVVFEQYNVSLSRTSLVSCDLAAACVTLAEWASANVLGIALSPDGARVAVLNSLWLGNAAPTTIEVGSTQQPGLVEKARWQALSAGTPRLGFSADGQHLLWTGPREGGSQWELHAAPVGPGTALRLGPEMVGLGDVTDFVPVGERVLFLADAGANELFSLYTVKLDGTDLALVHAPTLVEPGLSAAFALVPGQARAVLMSNHQSHGDDFYPYLVELDGSGARRLVGAMEDGRLRSPTMEPRFALAGDSLLLLSGWSLHYDLFTAGLSPGRVVRLNQREVQGSDWSWVAASGDGERVAWFELSDGLRSRPHVARVDGSEQRLLDQGFEALGWGASSGASGRTIAFTPDGQTLVYKAELVSGRGDALSAIGADGSGWRRLSPELVEDEELGRDFWISADSAAVVFWVRHATATALHAVSLASGADATLSSAPNVAWSFGGQEVLLSPDGQRAVFRERLVEGGAAALVSTRLDGQGRAILRELAEPEQGFGSLEALEGTGLLAFPVVAPGKVLGFEAVPFDGGPSTRLDRQLPFTASYFGLRSWSWSAPEQRLYYQAEDDAGRRALVSVDARGEGLRRWSHWVEAGTRIASWRPLPRSARVVYQLSDAEGSRLVISDAGGRERQLAHNGSEIRVQVSEDERWLVIGKFTQGINMSVESLRLGGLP